MNLQETYGLEPGQLDQVISILQCNRKIDKVVLFGSRAKGNFQNGSDVDLALFGEQLHLNDLLNISLEIDELLLPNKFDFIIYSRIQEQALVEHINRVGIVLFERNADVAL